MTTMNRFATDVKLIRKSRKEKKMNVLELITGDVPRGTFPTTYFTKKNLWYIINNVCFPYKTRHLLSMRVDTERFGKLC